MRTQDLGPDFGGRYRAALARAREALRRDLEVETEPRVREDLEIMARTADLRIEGSELDDRFLLPLTAVGRTIFRGEFLLLGDQVAPARRSSALPRLERYTGLIPGSTSLAELARARYEERIRTPGLQPPYRGEVLQDISDTTRYAEGVRKLFARYHVAGGEAALTALQSQLQAYAEWERTVVLPMARADFRLPPAVYAHDLRNIGLDIAPLDLIARAELEYSEVTAELQTVAPLVAAQRGWPETEYRAVIARLKREQLPTIRSSPIIATRSFPGWRR